MPKKKPQATESKGKRNFFLVILLLFVISTAYFNFFYTKTCKDKNCFDSSLAKCKKATFTNAQEEATWQYTIQGKKGNKCIVNVKSIAMAEKEGKAARGKTMLCSLPRGVVMNPISNLDECHGLLKEALQDIIIEKLHVYIVKNIGSLSNASA